MQRLELGAERHEPGLRGTRTAASCRADREAATARGGRASHTAIANMPTKRLDRAVDAPLLERGEDDLGVRPPAETRSRAAPARWRSSRKLYISPLKTIDEPARRRRHRLMPVRRQVDDREPPESQRDACRASSHHVPLSSGPRCARGALMRSTAADKSSAAVARDVRMPANPHMIRSLTGVR